MVFSGHAVLLCVGVENKSITTGHPCAGLHCGGIEVTEVSLACYNVFLGNVKKGTFATLKGLPS